MCARKQASATKAPRSTLWGMLLRETMLRRESPHKQFLRTALEIDAAMAVRLIRWIRRKGRGEL